MSQSAKSKERDEAIERLREWIKPGDTIYTILRHVSRSGMQREVSLKLFKDRGLPYHLDGNVALALGARIGKHDGVTIDGCGTDVGFELVYKLGRVLFPDGFGCVGPYDPSHPSTTGCHSNDHSNGDRDYTPHYVSTSQWVSGTCLDSIHALCAGGPPRNSCGCSCHNAVHWHRDGGYALIQRWL